MTKFEFTFNARIPYDAEEDPRDVTISFTTSDADEVIRQFNKRREEMLPDELAAVYEWIKELQHSIKINQVPSWLK